MRELKFRAIAETNLQGKRFIYSSDGIAQFWSLVEALKITPEQFTGLLDSKGREIYEGDILESIGAHREEQRRAIVSWCEEDTGFEAMPVGCHGEPWRLGSLNPRFWQIVSNIHESE